MSDFQNYLKSQLKKITIEDSKPHKEVDYNLGDDIGELVKETRIELGITQQELSKRTGISQSSISRIENGSSIPNLVTLKKIGDSIGKKIVVTYENLEEDMEDNGNTN